MPRQPVRRKWRGSNLFTRRRRRVTCSVRLSAWRSEPSAVGRQTITVRLRPKDLPRLGFGWGSQEQTASPTSAAALARLCSSPLQTSAAVLRSASSSLRAGIRLQRKHSVSSQGIRTSFLGAQIAPLPMNGHQAAHSPTHQLSIFLLSYFRTSSWEGSAAGWLLPALV